MNRTNDNILLGTTEEVIDLCHAEEGDRERWREALDGIRNLYDTEERARKDAWPLWRKVWEFVFGVSVIIGGFLL